MRSGNWADRIVKDHQHCPLRRRQEREFNPSLPVGLEIERERIEVQRARRVGIRLVIPV